VVCWFGFRNNSCVDHSSIWDVVRILRDQSSYSPHFPAGLKLIFDMPVEELVFFIVVPTCGAVDIPGRRSGARVRDLPHRSVRASMVIIFAFRILVDGSLTKVSGPIVIYNPEAIVGHGRRPGTSPSKTSASDSPW
jgi:hypothetical protein